MPNRTTDPLFLLIKSLEKSEKRNFKLYVKRHSGGEDLKIVQLFDALDKMDEYDEELVLSKNKAIRKQATVEYEGPFVPAIAFQLADHQKRE
jgi:hypothetical protein